MLKFCAGGSLITIYHTTLGKKLFENSVGKGEISSCFRDC